MYPVAVRVKELVAYQSSEFGAMDSDDFEPEAPAKGKKAAKKDTFREDFDLDDDLPL